MYIYVYIMYVCMYHLQYVGKWDLGNCILVPYIDSQADDTVSRVCLLNLCFF